MIKDILMTPWNVVRSYIKTVFNLPTEFGDWRQKIAQQAPIVYDEAHKDTSGLDLKKLYAPMIAYKLIFFWFIGSGAEEKPEGSDKPEGGNGKPRLPQQQAKHEGLKGFFLTHKMGDMIGTVFEFRLEDGYTYFTQRWLDLFGAKPRSFKLYQVIGGVKILDIPNSLEAASIGVLELKVQLGIDAYLVVQIPVNGEGSYWKNQFNEFHGVAAIAAMIEDAVDLAKKLHEQEFTAWRARVGGCWWQIAVTIQPQLCAAVPTAGA
ncbi:MAG: hypothetical protein UZ22_OP11002000661 [Microgenomates bacterium OLB23]|nr:MAG: hypothetical protein UZ22_OP11002000661 [Microgenomates bacterium OLB23]